MSELYLTRENCFDHTGAGLDRFFWHGERILNAMSQEMVEQQRMQREMQGSPLVSRPFAEAFDTIPREQWPERIRDKDAAGSWMRTINDQAGVPCLDQGSLGFCFTKDTRISLLDGTERSFEELMSYEGQIWVYSFDRRLDRVVPGRASKPIRTRRKTPILSITLDNEEVVRCTPEHRWLLRDGRYRRADRLKAGDSLMPLYRRKSEKSDDHNCGRIGYEMVLDPDKEWKFTHVMSSELATEALNYVGGNLASVGRTAKHCIRHHQNCDPLDNRPDNLAWVRFWDHFQYHKDRVTEWNKSERGRKKASERLIALHKDPGFAVKRDKATGATFRRLWKERRNEWSNLSSNRLKALNADPDFAEANSIRNSIRMTHLHADQDFVARRDKRNNTPITCPECGKVCGNIGSLGVHIQSKHEKVQFVACGDCGRDFKAGRGLSSHRSQVHANHKVVRIEPAGVEDVYDITVERYHNFALSAGVFVHNCHAYGTVGAAMTLRAIHGLPTILLSPESVGGRVTNWKNRGANPDDDLEVLVRYGACRMDMMDKAHSLNPKKWQQGWEQDALNHTAVEVFHLSSRNMFDELMTCVLLDIPTGVWFNWWSHHVQGPLAAQYKDGDFWLCNRNSWGRDYGENGYFWMVEGRRQGKATASGAHAVRVMNPSEI